MTTENFTSVPEDTADPATVLDTDPATVLDEAPKWEKLSPLASGSVRGVT